MLSSYSKDFFVFSYFGKTHEELDKDKIKAVEVCASRAYLDLNRTLVFNKDVTDDKKSTFRTEICKKIRENFCDLLNKQTDFETFHSKTCEAIINYAEESNLLESVANTNKKVFTYGHAQKWLNMTLKYMYILDFLSENVALKLHVPIDSYILKAISRKDGEYTLGNENIIPKFHEDDEKATSFGPYRDNGNNRSQPWSKLNEEDYKQLQEDLRTSIKTKFCEISPIDWEGKAWIEIAKSTK